VVSRRRQGEWQRGRGGRRRRDADGLNRVEFIRHTTDVFLMSLFNRW
jgi:hypothetical protein